MWRVVLRVTLNHVSCHSVAVKQLRVISAETKRPTSSLFLTERCRGLEAFQSKNSQQTQLASASTPIELENKKQKYGHTKFK